MNQKTISGKNEPKVLKFSELSKINPRPTGSKPEKRYSDSRIIGIEDPAKRKLVEKILKSEKSF